MTEKSAAGKTALVVSAHSADFVWRAGGAIALVELAGKNDWEGIFERVAEIGDSVRDLLREASENSESPLSAARRRVERILAKRN